MTAVVVAIKQLNKVKSRLESICTAEKRAELCLAMLDDMLRVFLQCGFLQGFFLITPDARVADWCGRNHPEIVVLIDEGTGLNTAAAIAGAAVAERGFDVMLFLHGDLPYVTPGELYRFTQSAKRHQVVLVPDFAGTGTTAIALHPPDVVATAFGPGSFPRHRQICIRKRLDFAVFAAQGISRDVDTPSDLFFQPLPVGGQFACLVGAWKPPLY